MSKDHIGSGWIGVDLDGTLAKYETWQGIHSIGEPIPAMVQKVKEAINRGFTVKIFTARACAGQPYRNVAIRYVQDWAEKHIGIRLEVTAEKDFSCIQIWDDRAKEVIHNVGEFVLTVGDCDVP